MVFSPCNIELTKAILKKAIRSSVNKDCRMILYDSCRLPPSSLILCRVILNEDVFWALILFTRKNDGISAPKISDEFWKA